MARTFKRDSRGRFATTDGPRKGNKPRLSKESLEALKASDTFKAMKQQRAVEKADNQVDRALDNLGFAERVYKNALKDGGDEQLENAWDDRIKAQKAYTRALERRAKVGQ